MLTSLRTPARAATVAFAALTLGACATNPVTGRREIALVSEAQEIQMGQQGAAEVVQALGLVNDQALNDYVNRVGMALAAKSERPNIPWSFRVVDDPTPNAFALPGGPIFVTRGMMNLMRSEAELAGVLGHEIGHITARHSVSQMSKQQLAQIGLGVGSILSPTVAQFGELAGTGLQLLFLKYGRDDERQSDELGFRYMLDQGYDVREFGDIFASLQRMGEAAGQSPIPSWMASHPDPGERVKTAQRRVAELNRPTTNLRTGEAEFLQRISGLVYGENPRNGFFENGVFYHPDMRFRFTIPSGWKAQNTPQAVVAVSPQQNAMVQLTLGKGSPEEAARQFLSQQGLQAGQPSRETINGIPAVASQFQAQTQQGVLQGLVAFFGYNGQTYQILGYGPAQGFAANQQAIRQVLGSFAPVNDQRILNVQPSRIEIVRIERPETLGAFAQRTGTTIPISELAILNQVEGAGTQLPVGFLAKRVTPGPGSR
jgi:predicted Zn-dependent protease